MKAMTLLGTALSTVGVGAALAGCTPVAGTSSIANAAQVDNTVQVNNTAQVDNTAQVNDVAQVNNTIPQPPYYPSGPRINYRGPIQFQSGGTTALRRGYLQSQAIDRYTFTAYAGQPTTITIGSPYRGVLLTLVDPNGIPIVRYQSGASSWSGTLPTTGTYRLDAVATQGPSPYDLSLNIQPAYNPPTPPAPPSSQVRYQGAIQFAPGATSTVVRNYLPYRYIDRYTFNATGGQSARINLYSPNQNVLLTIVDPNGNPIIRSQSGASFWSGILPTSGNYTVDAVSVRNASPYTLELNIQPFRRVY